MCESAEEAMGCERDERARVCGGERDGVGGGGEE